MIDVVTLLFAFVCFLLGHTIGLLVSIKEKVEKPDYVYMTDKDIVRCKDCRYCGWDIFDRGTYCNRVRGLDTEEMGFCNKGERRNEDRD